MPRDLISLLLALTIIWSAPSAVAQTCDPNAIPTAEYGRMTAASDTVVLIVPTKLSRDCLLALGKLLHEQKPAGRYELFDARDVNLGLYVRCNSKETDSKLACDRYSLKWIEKHTVGFLNVDTNVPGDRCSHWALFDKEHHSITEYERVSWCPYNNEKYVL